MSVIHVDNPDDERLSDFKAVSDPERARTHGVFIAEGRLVVRRLLTESRLTPRSVMVTSTAMHAIGDALIARPDLPVYVYPAGHGFNCDQRSAYHAESARLARGRTLAFLREHVD